MNETWKQTRYEKRIDIRGVVVFMAVREVISGVWKGSATAVFSPPRFKLGTREHVPADVREVALTGRCKTAEECAERLEAAAIKQVEEALS